MGDNRHYLIIVFDHHNRLYGINRVNPRDGEIKDLLTKIKSFGVPFTHRVWFSPETDIYKVLKEKNCEFQNVAIVSTLDELMSFIK